MDLTTLALVTQWIGTLLTLCLLVFLAQSIRRPLLVYWAAGWLSLAVSLFCLTIAFHDPRLKIPLDAVYFLGEYGFAFFLIAGCRHFISATRIDRRSLPWLPAALTVAIVLSIVSSDFNVQFIPHAAIMGICFLVAFRTLAPARHARLGGGVSVMSFALLMLAIDFLHYVPVFVFAVRAGPSHRFAYLDFTSVVDMVLEVLLGFGMVMLILDTLRREAESASTELAKALTRLEILARTDGLTNALNRHAYHALLTEASTTQVTLSGCVVIADVDKLKQINDTLGHAAGDAAIRSVATAIRSLIRADDLLFRWGGDEFLVILWNIEEEETSRRFDGFDEILRLQDSSAQRPPLGVSFGFAGFDRDRPLENAIELADSVMYQRKQRRHASAH